MSNSKHTPGPWYVGETRCIYSKLQTVDGTYVEPLIAQCTKLTTSADANAALIAAAPEMLEALERIEVMLQSNKDAESDFLLTLIQPAISKAKGGE